MISGDIIANRKRTEHIPSLGISSLLFLSRAQTSKFFHTMGGKPNKNKILNKVRTDEASGWER